jgi:glycerol kinase
MLAGQGIRVAPNASATKLQFLLDTYDPERARDLCFGTVDTWVAWTLSRGDLHVTDASNAAVTGMVVDDDGLRWNGAVLQALNVPGAMLPQIVDSCGEIGWASALPGSPVIAGIAGDQQASLIGQGCVRPAMAKATFGTGGMLDTVVGASNVLQREARGAAGCYPIVAWRHRGELTWGVEAIMLSAGSCIEWLREDLGLIETAADSERIGAQCEDTGDVWFVPALLGLGTPLWDFGARGALLGITRGTSRPHIVRAVLNGVAHRGADLLEAAEADGGRRIETLRVDGGMSTNSLFVQAVADACQRPIEVSPVAEATGLGAGFLAGIASGTWSGFDDVAAACKPARTVLPRAERAKDRDRWFEARSRSTKWYPDLSAIDF